VRLENKKMKSTHTTIDIHFRGTPIPSSAVTEKFDDSSEARMMIIISHIYLTSEINDGL
jgi:hypothetical protein